MTEIERKVREISPGMGVKFDEGDFRDFMERATTKVDVSNLYLRGSWCRQRIKNAFGLDVSTFCVFASYMSMKDFEKLVKTFNIETKETKRWLKRLTDTLKRWVR